MKKTFQKVFCAFCRLERKVCTKKHIGWTNVLLSFFVSIAVMFVVWQKIEPKAVLIFAISLMISEVFVQLRWRLSLPCPHCHFDPALYKRNPEQASQNVKRRLEALKDSGDHLLKANNPFQNLPKRPLEDSPKTKTSSLLSRRV